LNRGDAETRRRGREREEGGLARETREISRKEFERIHW
jgi:hypothetical protein